MFVYLSVCLFYYWFVCLHLCCPSSQRTALQGLFSQMGSRQTYPDQSLSVTASLTAENQRKLIEDCQWLLDMLEKIHLEVSDDGKYPTLIEWVKRANDEKNRIRDVVQKGKRIRMIIFLSQYLYNCDRYISVVIFLFR